MPDRSHIILCVSLTTTTTSKDNGIHLFLTRSGTGSRKRDRPSRWSDRARQPLIGNLEEHSVARTPALVPLLGWFTTWNMPCFNDAHYFDWLPRRVPEIKVRINTAAPPISSSHPLLIRQSILQGRTSFSRCATVSKQKATSAGRLAADFTLPSLDQLHTARTKRRSRCLANAFMRRNRESRNMQSPATVRTIRKRKAETSRGHFRSIASNIHTSLARWGRFAPMTSRWAR